MFAPLVERIRSLTGWRRTLLTVALGGVSALALPPFHLVPALWIAWKSRLVLSIALDPSPMPNAMPTRRLWSSPSVR